VKSIRYLDFKSMEPGVAFPESYLEWFSCEHARLCGGTAAQECKQQPWKPESARTRRRKRWPKIESRCTVSIERQVKDFSKNHHTRDSTLIQTRCFDKSEYGRGLLQEPPHTRLNTDPDQVL
jgi:hypothetical protein